MGNRVVAVPSTRHPLLATNLYQVLDTSDVPGGVVNIVTGERDVLARTLAEHDEVDAIWYVGSKEGSTMVEKASCGNLKATWVNNGRQRDWLSNSRAGQGLSATGRAGEEHLGSLRRVRIQIDDQLMRLSQLPVHMYEKSTAPRFWRTKPADSSSLNSNM